MLTRVWLRLSREWCLLMRWVNVRILLDSALIRHQVHMLDIECFTYLNALLESPMAPTVIFATNRGNALVRGTTDIVAPHGIPIDLLDRYVNTSLGITCHSTRGCRCLIVRTDRYQEDAVAKVVQLRANVEGLKLGPGVLELLAKRGHESSLRCVQSSGYVSVDIDELTRVPRSFRYALQLLTPASILAGLSGRKQIELEDINEMGELFLDAKASAEMIQSL